MKISFWITATVFYVVSVTLCNSVPVGTVLFTTTDLFKKCWTECDKSLLKARLIMQDVLPDPDCIDFSNPEAVMILLDYFHACFQIISTSTYGRIQNLMYIALSDALGGYLRAYVLPFTRRAYYAGQVKYSEARKLFQLYDDIKLFLKTNGMGWAKPQKPTFRKIYVTPLAITGGSIEACSQLFTIEKSGKLHSFNADSCLRSDDSTHVGLVKNSKENFREETAEDSPKNLKRFSNLNSTLGAERIWKNSSKVKRFAKDVGKLNLFNVRNNSRGSQMFTRNLTETISNNKTQELLQETAVPKERKSRCDCGCPYCRQIIRPLRRIIVPLPMLDDCESPHSIAVPFKKRPFRNLKAGSSAFVLEYYYIAVIKCFIAKGNTRADIKNFNAKFHSWLISQVYPHLNEEQWYPGFGGVLRVTETIKRFGMDKSLRDPFSHDIGYMFDSGVEFEVDKDKRNEKARHVNELEESCSYSKRHVITAIIIVSLIWIFVFCACAFYVQATKGRDLLYEGHSGVSNFTRRQCRDNKGNEKFINFQFLVKFFKKKDELEREQEIKSQLYGFTKQKPQRAEKNCEPKLHLKDRSKKKKDRRRTKKERTIPCKEKDFSALKMPASKRNAHPILKAWPCQPCLVPKNKFEFLNFDKQSAGDSKEAQNQIQNNQIQTLWKKPSRLKRNTVPKEGREQTSKGNCKWITSGTTSEDIFKEISSKTYSASIEDETKSTKKTSSSSCCSESCNHAHSTITNTSSDTQVEEKLSSATMEFFEEVISRHKPFKKYSTQESTEESDSEEECSSSSESNY